MIYVPHVSFSITGTARIYNCKFTQLNVFTKSELTSVITQGMRYNIKNEALISACFLPAGLGNMSQLSYSPSIEHV